MASGTTPSFPFPGPLRIRSRDHNQPSRPRPQGLLNHPALTGMDPAGVKALAAALEVPSPPAASSTATAGAARPPEGERRRRGQRKIDVTGHLLALRIREHLNLPVEVIGALLGVHRTTVSPAISLTASSSPRTRSRPPPRRPASACAPPTTCANTPPARNHHPRRHRRPHTPRR